MDRGGALGDVQSQRFANAFLNGSNCCVTIELHLTTKKVFGRNEAQYDIGVSYCRLGPTAAIASRSGLGSRTPRSHPKQPHTVYLGDAATSATDLK